VALKVLPEIFAADPDRLARFQREAQLLASLNHPHIAAIHGVEDYGPTAALVLELVEGPTLADRIAHGPIAVEEARAIAQQIALALEAAHDKGIVHRDLKPANVKVRDDGTVKVLDFGLARALESSGRTLDATQSPTITSPAMTQAGVLLGTAAYISPEVARGRTADRRSDIWAFGCVLYEMLAGRRAFDGADMTEVLGAVVRLEPDWEWLPSIVPPAVRSVLKRCLQKDPAQRMRDIADVRFQLDEAFAAVPPLAASSRAAYAGWVIALLVAVVAALALLATGGASVALPEIRLQVVTPSAGSPLSFAISPDGRSLVYQARVDGRDELWLRRLDSEDPRRLPGTDNAEYPFWSPDSRSVGFFAAGALKRIDVDGGFVRTLASAPNSRRAAWGGDGTILFGASVGPLHAVPADGGAVGEVTTLLPGQTNHRLPQFLPDGRRFLFFTLGARDVRGVYLASFADPALRRLFDRESAYAWLPPHHVLIARQGGLWARRLSRDFSSAEGDLVPVAPRVLVAPQLTGYGAFSTSSVGSFVYRASAGQRQLVWIDRAGRPLRAIGQPDDAQLTLERLSPDGGAAAVIRVVDGNTDIWMIDLERGVLRRLTFDAAIDGTPVFSPNGGRVVYVSDGRADIWDIFERRADGTGVETLFHESGENKQVHDWSSDGRYIVYSSQSVQTDYDIWALPLEGDRDPMPIVRTPYVELEGRLSPDAGWMAFQSNETGRSEIYVQPFPGPGPKVQISTLGGVSARWRADGRELFYVAPDNRLMAVALDLSGSTAQAGTPEALFGLSPGGRYEPASDGQQFLVAAVVSEPSPLTVVLNWRPPPGR
jgi:eukaryotic-like serine/threonine-protein kinase